MGIRVFTDAELREQVLSLHAAGVKITFESLRRVGVRGSESRIADVLDSLIAEGQIPTRRRYKVAPAAEPVPRREWKPSNAAEISAECIRMYGRARLRREYGSRQST
jgi:hypothetical protein